ncbi:flavin reductase family protein [Nocardia aurantia]|uniref:4-hydroxyphenylacetate 3-monooxygenase reductase component n=1 Tax=Nocardia aurantia TaxID=2585199 RepID=A0A7K0DMT1_9NOCA|nr:flavin reductase family protein [Nocardia aurantia]MQY26144.1 4-hydroxyphenylacetate 3-monooxygenase reductase component [Nocardia aurantia]
MTNISSGLTDLDVREAMARLVTGVTVVTTHGADGDAGTTINSFTMITLEPPTVMICLNTRNRGYAAVAESGRFAVNVLSGSQAWIAELFATPGLSQHERFARLDTTRAGTGCPIIAGAASWLDCTVTEARRIGTHGVFFAEVKDAGVDRLDEVPLVYFRRSMHPLRHSTA